MRANPNLTAADIEARLSQDAGPVVTPGPDLHGNALAEAGLPIRARALAPQSIEEADREAPDWMGAVIVFDGDLYALCQGDQFVRFDDWRDRTFTPICYATRVDLWAAIRRAAERRPGWRRAILAASDRYLGSPAPRAGDAELDLVVHLVVPEKFS